MGWGGGNAIPRASRACALRAGRPEGTESGTASSSLVDPAECCLQGAGTKSPSACPSGHEECAQAARPKECPSEIRVESTSIGSHRFQLINDQPSDSNRREDGGDREDAVVEHVTPLTPASSPSRRSAARASVRHRTRHNPRANLLSFKWERASRRRDLTAHPVGVRKLGSCV